MFRILRDVRDVAGCFAAPRARGKPGPFFSQGVWTRETSRNIPHIPQIRTRRKVEIRTEPPRPAEEAAWRDR